jgi:crotonobetainyl-CoA:carnitine CoA-transferase CaiB-like acyl-CoA transferase
MEIAMTEAEASKPLAGVRVLDLVVGPMAAIGRQLAELGADVLRLEPEGGSADRRTGPSAGGVSLDFTAANLGKRAGRLDRLDDLLAGADILLAGADYDGAAALARYPRLVATKVSPFGDTGRFASWQATGPVYHALTAELSRSGVPGREPLLPPGDLAQACAAVQGAYVVLLAYYNRLRTGVGDLLDFSVLDGAAQALDPGYGIAGSAAAGIPASKLPRGRAEARFMYPILPCKDGFVRLCILAPRQWQGMFEWMGRPEEFSDPAFDKLQNRFASRSLLPAIAKFFADKTRRDIEEAGQRHGVPAAAVLDLDEALGTEQIVARRAFRPVEIAPGISVPMPDGVVEIDGRRMGAEGPAPALDGDADWRSPPLDLEAPAGGERPLAGLRVLDLGVIVVGADSARLLGDQGADVLKIENAAFPDGSRQSRTGELISATFVAGHRNKRGLGLNLRSEEGKRLLHTLVAQSDVLMANFKGGTLQSLGLDYDSLKSVNPGIIVVDSSAFGPTGPWSRRMGYGPLVRASAGLTMQWRYPGEADSFSDAITVYPDHVAARIGAIATLALLVRRLRTGIGGSIAVSQAEVMLSHMAARIARRVLERAGVEVAGESAEGSSAVYRCAGDDEWCVVSLRGEPDRLAAQSVTGGEDIETWLAGQDPRAAMEALQAAGVPAGAMLRVSELPDFDYYVERGSFRSVAHPYRGEPHFAETAPVRSLRMPVPPEGPAPLPGEHTVKIAREIFGLDDTRIHELIANGALEQFTMPGHAT